MKHPPERSHPRPSLAEIPGRVRAIISRVQPEIDGGAYPIRRVCGEKVHVDAVVICDGHDILSARLHYRHESESGWNTVPMMPTQNDHWTAAFTCTKKGSYFYTLDARVDAFKTWRHDLRIKADTAAEELPTEVLIGVPLLNAAAARAGEADADGDARELAQAAAALADTELSLPERIETALAPGLLEAYERHPDLELKTDYGRELRAEVGRPLARFSAWYEMFPRSASPVPGRHGTLKDVEKRLPYVAEMGFDVLYLPPIHPIGEVNRKGPDNTLTAKPGDPGSPWAVGSKDGGHKSIHPDLGTFEDFDSLISEARRLGVEIALDIAFQCAPDHPYVTEHPEWFRKRPDGSVQYAQNPPKKYQDIYPFDFETARWESLWEELKGIFLFWIKKGVSVFRVDNPHTKSFRFWEWVIAEIKKEHPDTIFLSEAFTRPNMKYHLAKTGFTQSYTYFAWRNTPRELAAYVHELTRTEAREYFIPNFWPNTPDILPAYLQNGGRPSFVTRLILAATLSSSYGIYGPAFELMEYRPRERGSEEYLDSEKYQLRHWRLDDPRSLRYLVTAVNRMRREHPSLRDNWGLYVHETDNPALFCFSKRDESLEDLIIVVANTDPHRRQSGWLNLHLHEIEIAPDQVFRVTDLLDGSEYEWKGAHNYVDLDPGRMPVHVLHVNRYPAAGRDRDGRTHA